MKCYLALDGMQIGLGVLSLLAMTLLLLHFGYLEQQNWGLYLCCNAVTVT
jgi:hypothetical protein